MIFPFLSKKAYGKLKMIKSRNKGNKAERNKELINEAVREEEVIIIALKVI